MDSEPEGQTSSKIPDFFPLASSTWPNSLPNDAPCVPLVLCAQLMLFGLESWRFSLAGNDLGNVAPSSQAEQGPPSPPSPSHPLPGEQDFAAGDERLGSDPLLFSPAGLGLRGCFYFFIILYDSSVVCQEERT